MEQPIGAVTRAPARSTSMPPEPQDSPLPNEWRFPNQATPLGSSAYYSLRFAPKTLQDDLAALLAWRHQVHAILDVVSDPGVARLKLQWWRDELRQTYAGEPHHPLSRALHPVLERHALPQPLFIGIVDRVESEVLHRQPVDDADLDTACEQDLGALFELIARCHGLIDADSLNAARRLGGFCGRVYLIRDSGALARRDRAVFPVEELRAQGVSTGALVQPEHRSLLPKLLGTAATRARARLAESEGVRGMPTSIRARTRILESLLDELEDEDFDVADQRIGLTPLRKLWLAWRESRRS